MEEDQMGALAARARRLREQLNDLRPITDQSEPLEFTYEQIEQEAKPVDQNTMAANLAHQIKFISQKKPENNPKSIKKSKQISTEMLRM